MLRNLTNPKLFFYQNSETLGIFSRKSPAFYVACWN